MNEINVLMVISAVSVSLLVLTSGALAYIIKHDNDARTARIKHNGISIREYNYHDK